MEMDNLKILSVLGYFLIAFPLLQFPIWAVYEMINRQENTLLEVSSNQVPNSIETSVKRMRPNCRKSWLVSNQMSIGDQKTPTLKKNGLMNVVNAAMDSGRPSLIGPKARLKLTNFLLKKTLPSKIKTMFRGLLVLL